MTADEIVASYIESFGEKKLVYIVTEEEFMVLANAPGVIKEMISSPNGDGTFYNSLLHQHGRFVHVSSKLLAIS
jgi:hypothetical protein